ncbi:unnamed protein product [Coregonus sp. 'balchen']|nr:unnamed protein product [Coregonus sp. 'balchen']
MAKSDGCDYFRRSSLFWITTVTLSMGYFTWTVFWPQQVPYVKLGPLGTLSRYLVDNHHSLMYKGDKGVDGTRTRCLWFVQTVLFGFASLGLLLKYKPDHRPKQH